MIRKLILALVILAMAAVPLPALAWDGHGAGMNFGVIMSGSSASTGPSSASTPTLSRTTPTRRPPATGRRAIGGPTSLISISTGSSVSRRPGSPPSGSATEARLVGTV
jgi:hypothetical protein